MDIADRMRRDTITWRPDDNEGHPKFIIGETVEITEAESGYGPYEVLTIAPDDNADVLWRWNALGGVASKRLEQLGPQEGDRIGVKYKGLKDSPTYKGKQYKDWDVFLDRKTPIAQAEPAPTSDPVGPPLTPGQDATNRRAAAEVGDECPSDPPPWLDSEEAF